MSLAEPVAWGTLLLLPIWPMLPPSVLLHARKEAVPRLKPRLMASASASVLSITTCQVVLVTPVPLDLQARPLPPLALVIALLQALVPVRVPIPTPPLLLVLPPLTPLLLTLRPLLQAQAVLDLVTAPAPAVELLLLAATSPLLHTHLPLNHQAGLVSWLPPAPLSLPSLLPSLFCKYNGIMVG
jgi:hypothetical protein